MSIEIRSKIIMAIDIAVSSGARLFKACEAIHLCIRRLRRWRRLEKDGRMGGYRGVTQKFSEAEKDAIVEAMNAPEMACLSLKVAHATLMDTGVYLGSPATFYRVIRERGLRKNRIARKQNRRRPELTTTAPGQIWCWDISWLEAPMKGTYFYLYMAIDMFSRKVVAWEVFPKESGRFARDLFADALEAEAILPDKMIIHADNGKPMRSKCLRRLFNDLSVKASYSRPHTSNDNSYAESLFATLKGRVKFPEYFETIDSAREYCLEFFTWYNCFHLHSGLDYLTPMTVHEGKHGVILEKRNAVLERERILHPSRHGSRNRVYKLPTEVRLKHRTLMTAKA